MAAPKKPYRVECIKDYFDNSTSTLWHAGDVTTSDNVDQDVLKVHWRKLGGTPEDLTSAVEEEKSTKETKPSTKTKE